jgi:integrase
MSRLGAAPKSVHNRHGLMFQLMSYGCIEMGLRADNPCQKQPLPRDEYDRDIRFFNHGEWSVVRRCLRSDVHTMCDFALHTGVRWGELSALRVGDMTRRPGDELVFDVHITRAWSVRDVQFDDSAIRAEESETIKHKIGPTKTRKGRWVQVSGDLATTLLAQIAGKQQEEYVFTTARGNPWRYEDFYTDRWIPAMALAKEHGLNKHGTVHMLRHTYVVWLLADGEPIHVISVRLGHASIQITMDRYGGLLDLHDASSTKRMARLMAYAETAILPVALRQEEVDARAIRPGRRGDRRLRAAG